MGQGLVVQGVGPGEARRRGHRLARRLAAQAPTRSGTASAIWRRASTMLDPIKATIITPGLDVSGKFAKTGIPASIVTKLSRRARRHRREDRAVLVLHHVHHRHHQGPLEHAASPRCSSSRTTTTRTSRCGASCRSSGQAAEVRASRPARPVPADPRHVQGERRRARDHRDVSLRHAAGDEARPTPLRAWRTAISTASRSTSSKAA